MDINIFDPNYKAHQQALTDQARADAKYANDVELFKKEVPDWQKRANDAYFQKQPEPAKPVVPIRHVFTVDDSTGQAVETLAPAEYPVPTYAPPSVAEQHVRAETPDPDADIRLMLKQAVAQNIALYQILQDQGKKLDTLLAR